MVKAFRLDLKGYVVISTLLGCLGAFELYTVVPREAGDHILDSDAQWHFNEQTHLNVTIFGSGLHDNMVLFVSKTTECKDRTTLEIINSTENQSFLSVTGVLPVHHADENFICVIENEHSPDIMQKYLPFKMDKVGLQIPLWTRIIAACFLLCLSGLFSGLNLGLMSLDLTSLRILIETGNPSEKRYASKIEPVRKQGNFLLCTLLLGNVLVNNTLTIILDTLLGGLFAIIGATAGIVVMGEIIPQAICQRFGLVVGAKTLFITKIFMVLTGPVSWPISKLLDLILGEELGIFYRREQLKQLLMLTEGQHMMHKDEVTMIAGVLSINEKCVQEIMTDINDVYMLDIDTKINFEVMQEIMSKGFSRIPVYEGDVNNIVGLLFVKELAFVDPDDELPLESVIKFYKHQAHRVYGEMKVLELMQDFMRERYHMAIVIEVEEKDGKDSVYVCIGVVTLEDIIEEIIQQEIVDETDAYVNNQFKKKNEKKNVPMIPFSKNKAPVQKISPQLQLATFTFLSTRIPEFSEDQISSNILNKLLRTDVVREMEPGGKPIIEAGKPIDFMVMVLTGEVKVEIGMENMTFQQGPFSTFCIPALNGTYVPDVTVSPSDVTCQYLCILREDYRRAIEATTITAQDKPPAPPAIRGHHSEPSHVVSPDSDDDAEKSAPEAQLHSPNSETEQLIPDQINDASIV